MNEGSLFTVDEFKENFKKNKRGKKELKIQLQVCDYIKARYPKVIFFCDLASGQKLPIHIGALHKRMRSSRALPDLFIAYVKNKTILDRNEYSGLFLELKKDGTRRADGTIPPQWQKEKVNGVWVKYDHHAEQREILSTLRSEGYMADFACGFDEAQKLIDVYLG